MAEFDIPAAATARVHVLHERYVGLGTDAIALQASRELLRNVATVIIPGHSAPFDLGARA